MFLQYEVIQEGSDANDWVAVPAASFQPNKFGRVWNSTSFLRIRPWELPGGQEKGRYFMVQNINDVVVGHCEPRRDCSAILLGNAGLGRNWWCSG